MPHRCTIFPVREEQQETRSRFAQHGSRIASHPLLWFRIKMCLFLSFFICCYPSQRRTLSLWINWVFEQVTLENVMIFVSTLSDAAHLEIEHTPS